MLRSPSHFVIAVRKPDGSVAVYEEPLPRHHSFWRLPFLRGIIALYDALALGLKAMRLSLDMALPEEERKVAHPSAFAFQAASGIGLALVLFIVLPNFLTSPMELPTRWQASLVEGMMRLLIFIVFLAFVRRSKEAQRLFAYHAAEHKAVHAFENRFDLTVEGLKAFPPEHPRCGTAFVLFVLVVKVFVFAFLPGSGWKGLLWRLFALPLVAALSFELLRLGTKGRVWRWLSVPGIWLQRLTTREPDEKQLEVALAALKRLLEREGFSSSLTT